jgi:hypothetical protein
MYLRLQHLRLQPKRKAATVVTVTVVVVAGGVYICCS